MKYAILLMIVVLLFWIPPASADITWNQQCSITVHPGNNITCGNLQISNIQFSSPVKGIKDFNKNIVVEHAVTPSIFFDTNFEKSIFLTATEPSYINQIDKKTRIDVSGFPDSNNNIWLIESYSPSATLTIYTRQIPQVQLALTSNQPIYEDKKDKNINITLSVKNIDTQQFKPIRIVFNQNNTNLSNMLPSAQREFEYCCLVPSQTITSIYNLEVPGVNLNTTYSFNATIKLQDPEIVNKVIDYNVSTSVIVIPQNKESRVVVTKYIRDRFYTDDNASVVLSINNLGAYSLYGVFVNDTLPNSLYPVNSSQKLNWYIPEIKANDGIELHYAVYPIVSGSTNLGATLVKYSYLGQDYQTKSNLVSTNIINNPRVKLRLPPTPISTPIIRSKPTKPTQAQQGIVPKKPPTVATSTPASQSPIPTSTPPPQDPVKTPGFKGIGILLMISLLYFRKRLKWLK